MGLDAARNILHQLQYGETDEGVKGRVAMTHWRTTSINPTKNGLIFKVHGAKLKGTVAIEYMPEPDHYDIKIYNNRSSLEKHFVSAYSMDLVELIDRSVEF